MNEPAEALAKLISRYATDEAVSRQMRRLPVFAVPLDGNERLVSLLDELDEAQASATHAAQA